MTKIQTGFVAAAVVVIGVGALAFAMRPQPDTDGSPSRSTTEQSAASPAPSTSAGASNEQAAAPGAYVAYDESMLKRADTGNVVIFFHAPWCPECKALDADLKARPSSIPSDLTILKTDYDTQTALKQKYGITMQNTFVQVDASGNLLKK